MVGVQSDKQCQIASKRTYIEVRQLWHSSTQSGRNFGPHRRGGLSSYRRDVE